MGSAADSAHGPGVDEARRAALGRPAVACLVIWTLFVWIGRIRNATTDPDAAADRLGPVLLALTFVVPALVIGVALIVGTLRRAPLDRPAVLMVRLLSAWTVLVWLLRAGDIALGGDHPVDFVVVHTALAVVSIALAVLAVRATMPGPARRRAPSRVGLSARHGDTESR